MVDYRQKVTVVETTPQQNTQVSNSKQTWITIACLSFFPLVYVIGKTLTNIL